jgi:hypothetical protein
MADDPRFDRDETGRFLAALDPGAIQEVPG